MCHLTAEKVLKAIACQVVKKTPPETHDLIILLGLMKITLPIEQSDFLGKLNNVSVMTRYPENLKHLISIYPKLRKHELCIKKSID